jgi:hypothetical protein
LKVTAPKAITKDPSKIILSINSAFVGAILLPLYIYFIVSMMT